MADKAVQVALRIRPLVTSEISKGCKDVLEVYPDISQVRIRDSDRAFTYNHIFGPHATQNEVFDRCIHHMIRNLFSGYNLTILAYGQTGSGKTHTMGTAYSGEEDMGVIPRAVSEIFKHVRDNFTYDFALSVSFMELYQEVLYDLLADKSREQCVLDIREDSNKGVLIPGLTEVPVENARSVLEALMRGSKSRVTGATNMNAQSSRSHAIFTINVLMQNKTEW
ncbi:Kinesin domain containing protein [Asbolus verrucosus]|uniref:Kinesin domain containing protein n=1 Tax=Asbolus verrucosus TaxID=1661398 RepID=A0A482W1V9_ASBVE|nr:Kinesin domain containing protein [Asbolus verrucosus]